MTGQSGITQYGVQFPSGISQSGELWPESGEEIPYPLGAQLPLSAWPPAGFDLGSEEDPMGTALDSTLPPELDLEWVQGATKQVVLTIPGVNWTTVDPVETDVTAPAWEEHTWHAQVRNPFIQFQRQTHYWVPAYGFQYEWWRQHSMIAEFDAATALVHASDGTWGTEVTLTIPAWMSERLYPGSWYRWDVMSRSVVPVATPPAVQEDPIVIFHRRGRCRVISQWTIAGSNYRT
jgi:hypothetical protein